MFENNNSTSDTKKLWDYIVEKYTNIAGKLDCSPHHKKADIVLQSIIVAKEDDMFIDRCHIDDKKHVERVLKKYKKECSRRLTDLNDPSRNGENQMKKVTARELYLAFGGLCMVTGILIDFPIFQYH